MCRAERTPRSHRIPDPPETQRTRQNCATGELGNCGHVSVDCATGDRHSAPVRSQYADGFADAPAPPPPTYVGKIFGEPYSALLHNNPTLTVLILKTRYIPHYLALNKPPADHIRNMPIDFRQKAIWCPLSTRDSFPRDAAHIADLTLRSIHLVRKVFENCILS